MNTQTLGGKKTGEFCGECFDTVPHDRPVRPVRRGCSGSGPNHNDPSFDDVIRALEEDR